MLFAFRHMSSEEGAGNNNNNNNEDPVRDKLAWNAQKLLRSMKQLLAREKTLTITPPKKTSRFSPFSPVHGNSSSNASCSDVVATSSSGFGSINGPATTLRVNKRDPDKPCNNLQLLSQTSFPGMPSYPVLAASRSSPWNCWRRIKEDTKFQDKKEITTISTSFVLFLLKSFIFAVLVYSRDPSDNSMTT